MLKISLIIMLFCGCSYLGYIFGESFKKRLFQLNECKKIITLLQNQVIFNNTPLPQAIGLLANKVNKPFDFMLNCISRDLVNGETVDVYSAFYEEYKKHASEIYLNEEDRSLISDFTKSLGESGVYGQEKMFNLVIENLKFNIEEASDLAKKNTKLYRYLGICFGAMISILLI